MNIESTKLFDVVKEGYDSKNRNVFICKDDTGFYVSKPRNGFKSRSWATEDDADLLACFDRQCLCGHFHPHYEEGERPVEVTDVVKTNKVLTAEQEQQKLEKAEKRKAAAAAKKSAESTTPAKKTGKGTGKK